MLDDRTRINIDRAWTYFALVYISHVAAHWRVVSIDTPTLCQCMYIFMIG